jgi:hypothetical protein
MKRFIFASAITSLFLSKEVTFAQKNEALCAEDAKSLCADIKIGEGKMLMCLIQKWEDLSEACKKAIQIFEAQTKPKPKNPFEVCRQELKQFCDTEKPSLNALAVCLFQHKDEVSKDCKEMIKKARQTLERFMHACGTDTVMFCPNAPQTPAGVIKCLSARQEDLATECKAWLDETKSKFQRLDAMCEKEISELCSSKETTALVCLGQNRDRVSEGCREALDDLADFQ